MDSAGHEDVHTYTIYVHGDDTSDEEGVGAQLIHHCL